MIKRPPSVEFFDRASHGGSSTQGKRKVARPLAKKKWIHVVMKSSQAFGGRSLLKHSTLIDSLIKQKAKLYHVEIKDVVNMGNHLHCKLRFQMRKKFQTFLRVFMGLVARRVTGAQKGHKFGKFWEGLVFTRIIKTSFEELQLRGYFKANRIELTFGKKKRDIYWSHFTSWLNQVKISRSKIANKFGNVSNLKYQT